MRSILRILLAVAVLGVPAAALAQAKAPIGEVIELKGTDGITLKATYYAAAKPGPGLLLFHACNKDRSSWATLASAAAARGYHVLAMDYRGFGDSGGDRFQAGPQNQGIVENQWPLDVDAAYAWLTSRPGVDKTRLAAGGASCGVDQSVLLARRHPEVKTVVLLSGGLSGKGRAYIRDNPNLPIFAAASRGDSGAVDQMRWTLAWSANPANKFVEYKAAGHGTDMFGVEKGLEPQVLTWLDAHVMNASAKAPKVAAAPPKMTPAVEFWTIVNEPGGVPRAKKKYDEAKSRGQSAGLFNEAGLNIVGYGLLQAGENKDALVLFQMNAEAYPDSANTYDSLSDAYLALGERAEALRYAQKALEMLPKDTEATPEFKQLVRESAEKKVNELKGTAPSAAR